MLYIEEAKPPRQRTWAKEMQVLLGMERSKVLKDGGEWNGEPTPGRHKEIIAESPCSQGPGWGISDDSLQSKKAAGIRGILGLRPPSLSYSPGGCVRIPDWGSLDSPGSSE